LVPPLIQMGLIILKLRQRADRHLTEIKKGNLSV
jgi:hypothetical protein